MKSKIFKFIKKTMKIFSIFLFMLFILEIFVKDFNVLSKILNLKYAELPSELNFFNTSNLEQLYYISAIISLIFIGYQVYISRKDMVTKFEYQKREKAVNMAEEFSKMIKNTTLMNLFIQGSVLGEKLNKDPNNYIKLKEFDVEEMKELFELSPKDVEDALNIEKIKFESIAKIYIFSKRDDEDRLKKYELCKKNKFKIFSKQEIESAENNIKEEMQLNNDYAYIIKSEVGREIQSIIINTLNRLEWFAMNFVTKIADEKTVYQSLHQVYLRTIKSFYFYIAVMNRNGTKDKYFCYIIELYNIWAKVYNEAIVKEKEAKEKERELLNFWRGRPQINNKDLTK